MKCKLCKKHFQGLIILRHYDCKGIRVCKQCYDQVELNKGKPYSKVMENLAVNEAGYHANRKLKR